jgi:uncharacterized damage-inducible protein DinB
MSGIRLAAALACLAAVVSAQKIPPGIGKGWLPEFDHAAGQTLALAEATPADKFAFRPAPGVRSMADVYMHLAQANYFLMAQAGIQTPADIAAKMKPGLAVTAKADVIKWLKDSQEFVRSNYPKLDAKKKVNFISGETTVEGVLLRILVHSHEHMGQAIAYARMAGVKPPWSE